MADNAKFENQDLPKILLALKEAREAGRRGQVIVSFDDNGGVLAIAHESTKKFK